MYGHKLPESLAWLLSPCCILMLVYNTYPSAHVSACVDVLHLMDRWIHSCMAERCMDGWIDTWIHGEMIDKCTDTQKDRRWVDI